jgi:hypothetical protein
MHSALILGQASQYHITARVLALVAQVTASEEREVVISQDGEQHGVGGRVEGRALGVVGEGLAAQTN